MAIPDKPCPVCGSNEWWQRADGGWNCSRCHHNPNPEGAAVVSNQPGESPPVPVSSSKKAYSSETLALRDRVMLGNKKLADAFEQLKQIADDKERWAAEMERWHQANEKLSAKCTQLEALGYRDCLYLDGQGRKTRKCLEGWGCQVCPSKIPYSERELMELPSPGEE